MRVRLSPSVSLAPTESGVMLRSDLGSFQLQGPDWAAVLEQLLPLLDGTRDEEAVAEALPGYSRESVVAVIRSLSQRGLVEEVPDRQSELERPWPRAQELFFGKWTDAPEEALDRLRRGRVLLAGLEPWGAVAAAGLAEAGLGRLHLLDTGPRAAAQRDSIGRAHPACEVTAGRLDGVGEPDQPPEEPFDLLVVTLAADELLAARELALLGQRRGLVSLWAGLEGLDAVVGPVVIPRRSACWNCRRLRLLANAADQETELRLQSALLATRAQPREHTLLGPMGPWLGHLVALEAIKLLTRYTESGLVGRFLAQNLVTLESTFHTVIRLPWCDVCGGAAAPGGGGGPVLEDGGAGEAGGDPPRSLRDVDDPHRLRSELAGWIDARAGVIRYVTVNEPAAGEPELPVAATAVFAAGAPGTGSGSETGSGKGLTAVDALLGAVGEAVERYSASLYDPGGLRRAAAAELEGDVLEPRRLCLYLPEQYRSPGFPFRPPAPGQAIDWARGSWIAGGAPVWVPALVAYFNFPAPPEEYFCQVTSNGLATAPTFGEAALHAVLELVERDALMLTWLARLPARRLILDSSLDAGGHEVVRQLGQAGCQVSVHLLDVGSGIPAVACLGQGDGDSWPAVTVSAAAHLDPRRAALKAILEQGHVGPYIRRLTRSGEHPVPASPADVRTLTDHALYYAAAERRPCFDFLTAGPEPAIALGDLAAPAEVSLEECARRLAGAGLEVAVVDVTSPDVATGPFRVARAVGADMQPIHFGHGLARLASPRLQARLGDVNPDPHPVA